MSFIFKVILILIFSFAPMLSAQVKNYSNKIDIGNNDDFRGFDMLDSLVGNKRLVFSGIVNSYSNFNSKLEFKLLKYLNDKSGFRNYLLEIGPAQALMVNQFVNSNDSSVEKLLQSVSTLRHMKLYRNLKKLNQNLPDSAKFRVYGLDVERFSGLPLRVVSQLLPEDSIPDDLRIAVEAVEGAAKYLIIKGLENYEREKTGKTEYSYYYNPTSFSVRESLNEFIHFYDSMEHRFKDWLGDIEFSKVKEAVGWMKENKEWEKYNNSAFQFSIRENHMFSRMNELHIKMPGEKFFGQFELCRVSKQILPVGCDFYQFSGIANRMANCQESVCTDFLTIGVFYNKEGKFTTKDNEKRTSFGQESVHAMLHKNLAAYFDSVKPLTAVFYKPEKKSDSVVYTNYDILLLNKDYPLPKVLSDTSESDSLEWENKEGLSWIEKYDRSRMYVGFDYLSPQINLGKINAILVANAIDGIGNLNSYGASIGFVSPDKTLVRIFYGHGSDGSNYSNDRVHFNLGYSFLFSKYVKMSISPGLGYVKHRLALNQGNTNQTFFPNYVKPKVLVNPGLIASLATSIFLEYAPFYAFAEGGRMNDLGDTRWSYNGNFTGSSGRLSNSAWYVQVGFGVALKWEWMGL